MATGASGSDLAVLLVDARHGIREQTRRHARIARLLGISSFVLAVNKMDLVGFDADVFARIRDEFSEFLLRDLLPSGGRSVPVRLALQAIPLSALDGDNVTTKSARTPWYDGPALLPYLETVDTGAASHDDAFRLPVQLVLRPDHQFRGYAGQIASGSIRTG